MDRRIDSVVINSVLKTLCRENGIERDRKSVMQVATLLLALWKQGVNERDELERRLGRSGRRPLRVSSCTDGHCSVGSRPRKLDSRTSSVDIDSLRDLNCALACTPK